MFPFTFKAPIFKLEDPRLKSGSATKRGAWADSLTLSGQGGTPSLPEQFGGAAVGLCEGEGNHVRGTIPRPYLIRID